MVARLKKRRGRYLTNRRPAGWISWLHNLHFERRLPALEIAGELSRRFPTLHFSPRCVRYWLWEKFQARPHVPTSPARSLGGRPRVRPWWCRELDLTPREAAVYLALAEGGRQTVRELSRRTGPRRLRITLWWLKTKGAVAREGRHWYATWMVGSTSSVRETQVENQEFFDPWQDEESDD